MNNELNELNVLDERKIPDVEFTFYEPEMSEEELKDELEKIKKLREQIYSVTFNNSIDGNTLNDDSPRRSR